MLEMLLLVVKSPPFIVILVAETRVGPVGSVGVEVGQEAMKAKKERARRKKNGFAVISVFPGVKLFLLLFILMLFFINFLLKCKHY